VTISPTRPYLLNCMRRMAREMADERLAELPRGAGGEQGPVGEASGSDKAPPASVMEEGQGALQD
jgi:hypothetical protein